MSVPERKGNEQEGEAKPATVEADKVKPPVDYKKKLRQLLMNKVPPQYSCFKRKNEHRCRLKVGQLRAVFCLTASTDAGLLKVLGRITEKGGENWEVAMQAAAKECFEELRTATRSRSRPVIHHP